MSETEVPISIPSVGGDTDENLAIVAQALADLKTASELQHKALMRVLEVVRAESDAGKLPPPAALPAVYESIIRVGDTVELRHRDQAKSVWAVDPTGLTAALKEDPGYGVVTEVTGAAVYDVVVEFDDQPIGYKHRIRAVDLRLSGAHTFDVQLPRDLGGPLSQDTLRVRIDPHGHIRFRVLETPALNVDKNEWYSWASHKQCEFPSFGGQIEAALVEGLRRYSVR